MTIPAAAEPLSAFQGTNQTLQVTVYLSDGLTPMDVTGYGGNFLLTAYGDPNTVFLTKAWTVADGPGGVLQVALAPADTAGLFPGGYAHAWQRTDTGNVSDLVIGPFTLLTP